MGASYPKPDDQKVTRHAPQFGWVDLPAGGRAGAAPKLPAKTPEGRAWSKSTRDWWAALWAKPQATQWDLDDASLVRLAALQEKFWRGDATASEMAESRQIEDRHGLNPKAMLQLRWRITAAPDNGAEAKPTVRRKTTDRRKRALKVIDGGA